MDYFSDGVVDGPSVPPCCRMSNNHGIRDVLAAVAGCRLQHSSSSPIPGETIHSEAVIAANVAAWNQPFAVSSADH